MPKCKSTHGILPTWIVPYSQHLLEDQVEIISAYESGLSIEEIKPENPESTITRYINQLTLEEGHTVTKEMRRYERQYINEVWYADTSAAFSLYSLGFKLSIKPSLFS